MTTAQGRIADEKYVSFTTYRRSGEAVSTPVWIAPLGQGRAGFTTGGTSGKAKRLAHTPGVLLQPCTQRGVIKEGSVQVRARAKVIGPEDPEFDAVLVAIRGKYRFTATAIMAAGKVIGALRPSKAAMSPDAAVVIDFD